MLKIVKEFSFEDLKEMVWSGAKYTLEVVEEHGLEDELMMFLEDLTSEELVNDTAINDLLWHDASYIFEILGIEEE